jgi:hypothetical protein
MLGGDVLASVGSPSSPGGKNVLASSIAAIHRIMTITPSPTVRPIFTR